MANNLHFKIGSPNNIMEELQSEYGTFYLTKYEENNQDSNRLYIGTSNANKGGIMPITAPTPYHLTIKINGQDDNSFVELNEYDGSENATVNLLINNDGVYQEGSIHAVVHYAICNTSAEDQNKTTDITGYQLIPGARAHIKFLNTNVASNPTLDISGSGSRAISFNNKLPLLIANVIYTFIYDGVNYVLLDENHINNKLTSYVAGYEVFSEIHNDPNNIASGAGSYASGVGTVALNEGSHAEGGFTISAGIGSHAEGGFTKALELGSHAEGGYTQALGGCAHAEGGCSVDENMQPTEQFSISKDGVAYVYTGPMALGGSSHAEGVSTAAVENGSHAEGFYTIAKGFGAHAEGENTIASGDYSHAEGEYSEAEGHSSHAEGNFTYAEGDNSHSEGADTYAGGDNSHAEGQETWASGTASHTEGYLTDAAGDYSHAQNLGTRTSGEAQTAIGKYNIGDATSAFIIGNGSDVDDRSNIHTLDWDGNAWYAGDIYVGSTSGQYKDGGSKRVLTEVDLNKAIITCTFDNSEVIETDNPDVIRLKAINPVLSHTYEEISEFSKTIDLSIKINSSPGIPLVYRNAVMMANYPSHTEGLLAHIFAGADAYDDYIDAIGYHSEVHIFENGEVYISVQISKVASENYVANAIETALENYTSGTQVQFITWEAND